MANGIGQRHHQGISPKPFLILPKILVIRFSSIGDIVLTTPVIRCLHEQHPGVEIHLLTKAAFADVLKYNPHISKIHAIEKHVNEITEALKQQKFDRIVDLHHNLRSLQVIRKLGIPSTSFQKLNIEKWLRVNLKIDRLPRVHIVDRYFRTVEKSGLKNDGKGLDFHFRTSADDQLKENSIALPEKFIAMVIGAKHGTKILPEKQLGLLVSGTGCPVVLLGGKEDEARAREIMKQVPDRTHDLVGKTDLHTSAAILSKAHKVITHDTGLMHIAAALKKEIISIWGNTIPEFGMYPYLTPFGNNGEGHIFEVPGLKCRPCSKLGYEKCPKEHFDCMKKQDLNAILRQVNA